MVKIKTFLNDETGATAIEYALIASATGLALVATLPAITAALGIKFNALNGALL